MTETQQLTLRPELTLADRLPLSLRYEELMRQYYTEHGWDIDEYLAPMIIWLAAYWAGDPYFEDCEHGQRYRWSLRRSICISGPPGGGKSTLMEASNYALQRMRSPMAFATYETKALRVAFEKKDTGGMSAISGILCPKHLRHIYYDEIGKKMIAEVRHFATTANLDILVLEFREDLWRKGHYMCHSTTNMSDTPRTWTAETIDYAPAGTAPGDRRPSELAEWLTAKYISRFHQISNIIPYVNATDYRTLDLPRGGMQQAQPSEEERAESRRSIAVQTLRRFAAELITSYQAGTEYIEIRHETAVYYALVSMGYMKDREPVPTDPYYTEAYNRMVHDAQVRRAMLTDRKEARRMADLIALMGDGMALTSEIQAMLRIAFQKVLLRHFIEERLPDEEAVRRAFKKLMEETYERHPQQ